MSVKFIFGKASVTTEYYRLSLMGGEGNNYGSECFEIDITKQAIEDNSVGVGDVIGLDMPGRKGSYTINDMWKMEKVL